MNVMYQDNSKNINLEDIRQILKVISDLISKPSRYMLNKFKSNPNNQYINKEYIMSTTTETSENQLMKFNAKKIELYDQMDSLSESLKKNRLFNDEYFDFCEIQDITKDTLNRKDTLITTSDLKFLLELIIDFSDIINYKIDLIEKNEFDEKEYESTYNSYLTSFNKSKIYFYENICDETLDDDLFIEYTNIIMR